MLTVVNTFFSVFFLQFIQGATDICEALQEGGYWADFIDPSCGKPVSIIFVFCSYLYNSVLIFFNSWFIVLKSIMRNVLFNNALNKFYLWLYGIRRVKGPLKLQKKNPTCCCHYMGYSFQLAANKIICTIPQTGALAGTRKSSMGQFQVDSQYILLYFQTFITMYGPHRWIWKIHLLCIYTYGPML